MRKLSEETKEKIRQSAMGHKRNVGRKLSKKTKKLIGDANRGHRHTDELKRKLSKARYGIPLSEKVLEKMRAEKSAIMECPHCGKIGKSGGMKKHHMKNCKARSKPKLKSTEYAPHHRTI